MIYRRDEAFRFTFGVPIDVTFKIVAINGLYISSKEGSASLLDLSPNGLRISSSLDLPIKEKQLIMEVSFTLNERKIFMLAEPKWKKKITSSVFAYGLSGLGSDETQQEIIEELKVYSKNQQSNK